MRSRNVWPRSAVIRTTIRSERTFVPPVTAERSPPDSRITGADSPVIADSSTDAIPSTISPSEGITSPASHTTRSPLLSADAGTRSSVPSGRRRRRLGFRAHPPKRLGLSFPSPLRHGLGEIGEDHRQEQPDRDAPVKEAGMGDGLDERHHRADEHDEHDRVLDLDPRVELLDRVDERLAQDLAVEQAPRLGHPVRRGRRTGRGGACRAPGGPVPAPFLTSTSRCAIRRTSRGSPGAGKPARSSPWARTSRGSAPRRSGRGRRRGRK